MEKRTKKKVRGDGIYFSINLFARKKKIENKESTESLLFTPKRTAHLRTPNKYAHERARVSLPASTSNGKNESECVNEAKRMNKLRNTLT